jgi:hypothetical protein
MRLRFTPLKANIEAMNKTIKTTYLSIGHIDGEMMLYRHYIITSTFTHLNNPGSMEHHCHIKLISHIAIRHIWYSSMIE